MRVVLIGLGRQGQEHLRPLRMLHQARKLELVGVCDVVKVNAPPEVPFFGEYQVMLAETKPDLVVIATPNVWHEEMVRASLQAGAHVFVEKPPALTYDQGQQLLRLAQLRHRLLITAQQRFYSPLFLETKKLLPQLGILRYFSYTFTVEDRQLSWYWQKDQGGGVWLNLGWHALAITQWLFGEITEAKVQSHHTGQQPWSYDTDDRALAEVHVSHQCYGSIFVSCTQAKQETLHVFGSSGMLELNRRELRFTSPKETQITPFPKDQDLYLSQYQHVLDLIGLGEYDASRDMQLLQFLQQPQEVDETRST